MFFLILVEKTLFHDIFVLVVDTTVYSTQTNCAYPLAKYRTYKIDRMTNLPTPEVLKVYLHDTGPLSLHSKSCSYAKYALQTTMRYTSVVR